MREGLCVYLCGGHCLRLELEDGCGVFLATSTWRPWIALSLWGGGLGEPIARARVAPAPSARRDWPPGPSLHSAIPKHHNSKQQQAQPAAAAVSSHHRTHEAPPTSRATRNQQSKPTPRPGRHRPHSTTPPPGHWAAGPIKGSHHGLSIALPS